MSDDLEAARGIVWLSLAAVAMYAFAAWLFWPHIERFVIAVAG